MRLSVGIIAIVLVFTPSTTLSFIALVLILRTSIEFVIFGSFVPYSVFVISFFSNPIRSPKFVCLKSSWNLSSDNVINPLYVDKTKLILI